MVRKKTKTRIKALPKKTASKREKNTEKTQQPQSRTGGQGQ